MTPLSEIGADDGGSPESLLAYTEGVSLLFDAHPDPAQAIVLFERAAKGWKEVGAVRHRAMALGSLGSAHLRKGTGRRRANFDNALACLEKARDLLKPFQQDPNLAHTEYLLGWIFAERGHEDFQGDLALALGFYARSYQRWARVGNPAAVRPLIGAATALRSLLSDGRLENQELALELLGEAKRTLEAAGQPAPAELRHALGLTYMDRLRGLHEDNIEAAVEHLSAAVSTTGDGADKAESELALAEAYLRRSSGTRSENLRQARLLANVSAARFKTAGELERMAAAMHAEAKALADAEASGKLIEALALNREALAVLEENSADPRAVAAAQNSLAVDLLRGGDSGETSLIEPERLYRTALETFTAIGAETERLMVLRNMAAEYFNRSKWAEAETAFNEALATADRLAARTWTAAGRRKEAEIASRLPAAAAFCALRLGAVDRALTTLDAGRARVLAENLRLTEWRLQRLPPKWSGLLRHDRDQVRRLERAMLAQQEDDFSEMHPLLAARRRLSDSLVAATLEFPGLLGQRLTVEEIAAQAPQGGALVMPLVTNRGGACFIMRAGQTRVEPDCVLELPQLSSDCLTELIRGSRTRVGWLEAYQGARLDQGVASRQRWHAAVDEVTFSLWDLLMGAVDERLRELIEPHSEVVLLPQGGLSLLPLHAAAPRDGRITSFLHEWPVRLAPSATALQELRQGRMLEPSLLAVVDPSGELDAAEAEVEAVARHVSPESCLILRGEDVTATMVSEHSSGHRFVHFASHGSYNWQDPLASHLDMYGEDKLDVAEILTRLDLSGTAMVVLSACETGLVEFDVNPDEYVGLTTAFLGVGARCVISTLWAVSDLPTALLIARMYDVHARSGVSPALALASAQQWLASATVDDIIREPPWGTGRPVPPGLVDTWELLQRVGEMQKDLRPFAHPTFWAAFTCTGA